MIFAMINKLFKSYMKLDSINTIKVAKAYQVR